MTTYIIISCLALAAGFLIVWVCHLFRKEARDWPRYEDRHEPDDDYCEKLHEDM